MPSPEDLAGRRRAMSKRLLLSYLSVVLVVLVVLEVPLAILASRHERSVLTSQAVEEANGLAVFAGESIERGDRGLSTLVGRYHESGGSEVLIFYGGGNIVVDSDHDPARDRRELSAQLAAAQAGRAGTASVDDDGHPFAVAVVPLHRDGAGDKPGAGDTGTIALYLPAAVTLQRIHTAWLVLVAFGLAVLALTATLGAWLARSISRPIAALERSVGRLGQGDLAARAEPQGPRELQNLALEFNGMAERLEHRLEAQSRFVADASHQLRSPLAALRLRLENLGSEVHGSALASVEAANVEVQRLTRLIDGLLALTRADEERPEPGPVDIPAAIAERVEAWSALADERGVTLADRTRLPSGTTAELIPGDLEQILDNYLANALEATPPGRGITVEATRSPSGLDILVVDQGGGMSPAERERAFDRFWQGPHTPTGSSGLGLAIVRQLAVRNHARVAVLPGPGSNGGTTAVLHLHRPGTGRRVSSAVPGR